jgi:hypothetical protein
MSHGKGTWQVNGNSTRRVRIEAGGEGVVAHAGLHALGAFADRLGLGDALSARIPPAGERLPLHDRGKVLTQAMLMLAGGGGRVLPKPADGSDQGAEPQLSRTGDGC